MDEATVALIAAISGLVSAIAGYLLRPKGDKLVAKAKASLKPPSQSPPT